MSAEQLLAEADRQVRTMAVSLRPVDTVAALATWPELVEAVQQLVATCPDAATTGTVNMVAAIAASMHRTQLESGWPPVDALHDGLLHAAERVNLATETQDLVSPDVAERALLLLYHGAHVIRTGLDDQISVQIVHGEPGLAQSLAAAHRLGRSEQLLDAVVNPWPWSGPTPQDLDLTSQLTQALATWDVTAHRALAEPTVTKIRDVAVGQVLAHRVTLGVLDAAASDTKIAGAAPSRLSEAAQDAAASWQGFALAVDRLTPGIPGDTQVWQHQRAVNAVARRALMVDGQLATPAQAAALLNLAVAGRAAHQVVIAGADLARAAQEAVDSPALQGSARALLQLERERPTVRAETVETTLIKPADALRNRPVVIPPDLRMALRVTAGSVVQAADRAADRAMVERPFPGVQRQHPGCMVDRSPAARRPSGRPSAERLGPER